MEKYGVKFQRNFCTQDNFEEQRLRIFSCQVNENKGSMKNGVCEMDGSRGIGPGHEHEIMVEDRAGAGRGRNLF